MKILSYLVFLLASPLLWTSAAHSEDCKQLLFKGEPPKYSVGVAYQKGEKTYLAYDDIASGSHEALFSHIMTHSKKSDEKIKALWAGEIQWQPGADKPTILRLNQTSGFFFGSDHTIIKLEEKKIDFQTFLKALENSRNITLKTAAVEVFRPEQPYLSNHLNSALKLATLKSKNTSSFQLRHSATSQLTALISFMGNFKIISEREDRVERLRNMPGSLKNSLINVVGFTAEILKFLLYDSVNEISQNPDAYMDLLKQIELDENKIFMAIANDPKLQQALSKTAYKIDEIMKSKPEITELVL